MIISKPISQEQRLFNAIKNSRKPNGVTNWQLSRIALKYSSRIAELRHDGYNIYCERDHLPNSKATNTFRYYLNEGE